MKKLPRNKEGAKGSQKISDYFTKTTQSIKKSVNSNKDKINHGVVIVDSEDDDFVEYYDRATSRKKRVVNKENIANANSSKSETFKKRKVEEIDVKNPPQKTFNVIEEPFPSILPSKSEYEVDKNASTINEQIIFIKSPEKLLSTQALKEYHSPERQLERFLDRIHTPSPRKLLFDDAGTSKKSLNSFLTEVDKVEMSKKGTPKKKTPKKVNDSLLKTPVKNDKKEETPRKRTPKKLFQRSPNNLNEFKVQVVDNFINITPSKSNIIKEPDADVIVVKSSEKKQSSILKYISPSPKSLEAQNKNESTPTKSMNPESKTPTSKVKTRLDFIDCRKQVKTPQPESKFKENCENKMNGSKESKCDNINITNIDFDDGWEDEIMMQNVTEYTLDLTESQHCKIISINPFSTKSVLTLKSTKTGEHAICNLEGFWVHCMLSIGDTIHVAAKKLNETEWLINNDNGLLIYEPDLLISTTSVVGSLWCKRRSVLSERFRGFEPANEVMLIGTLAHNVLQNVLKHKIHRKDAIEGVVKRLLKESRIIRSLYECGITLEHMEKEVMKFVPNIEQFINLYLQDHKSSTNKQFKKDDWKGTIKTIDDIEENIWCPELGLKGKVDVSIKTDFHTMPLEVKTGRATVSLEHKGQVMLYVMMMNKLGYDVPSGLLLYLREGVLREIPMTQKEKRDIILLRNELTYYLTRKPTISGDDVSGNKKSILPELPQPINNLHCQKCPYNVICTSYSKYNDEDISSFKTLKSIQTEVTKIISDSHLNYFMKWVALVALEADSDRSAKNLREIYTLTHAQRNINGKCITYLKVVAVEEECNGVIEHIFEKINSEEAGVNFFSNGIMENHYVVVSTDARPAVAAGFVSSITTRSISVTLDRDLNQKYANSTFHIDSYDSNSIQAYNLSSLTLLLELSPRAEELRKIIINKIPPTFKSVLPKVIGTKGKTILKGLNIVQQRAVLKAIAANEYFLIRGMPGTGKTATIVALIQLLSELNKSVLITSHTHSAVDNVCIKLLERGVKLIRLGAESKVDSKLREYSEHNLIKHCTTPKELEQVYNNTQVLAVTCLGSGHPVLSKRTLDICIVDESTQVLQCSVIKPLYAARTFILIGDPDQLPPIVTNKTAREMGMTESLLERLCTKENMIALNLNYRMNTRITALANEITYNGELLIGNENVANTTLKLPKKEDLNSLKNDYGWVLEVLDDSLEKAVQFIDTGPVWKLQHNIPWKINTSSTIGRGDNQNEHFSCLNVYEAAVTVKLVESLLLAGVLPNEIGVIATYRIQVAQISSLLKCDNVDVSTVDRFQGKDKSVIIYSCTNSKDTSGRFKINKFEILEDKRRITVAVTRAKHKLIIIGDVETVIKYSTFQKLLPFVEKNIIRLNEYEGFEWKSVLGI